MPNLAFELNIKANNGTYVPLSPNTVKSQIIDWSMGELYGPIQVTLPASGWQNLQQTVTVEGIQSTDIPFCIKVLSGTVDEMKAQDAAYSLLDPRVGIESLQNQCRFTCTSSAPTVDLTVQIHWTR